MIRLDLRQPASSSNKGIRGFFVLLHSPVHRPLHRCCVAWVFVRTRAKEMRGGNTTAERRATMFSDQPDAMSRMGIRGSQWFTMDSIVLAPGESSWGQRLYIAVQSGTTVPVVKGAPIAGLETQIVFKRRVREEIRRRSVVPLCSPINLTRCRARESVDHNSQRWTSSFLAPGERCCRLSNKHSPRTNLIDSVPKP